MLTIREFCARTKLHERTIRRMIQDGRLRVIRFPGVRALRIRADEAARFDG